MVNFGPQTADIDWHVWGTHHILTGFTSCFVTAPMLLNHTLHDVLLSPGLVHYIYIVGGSSSLTEFCHVQNSLCVQVLRFPTLAVYCMTLKQWASVKLQHSAKSAPYIPQGGHHIGHIKLGQNFLGTLCGLYSIHLVFLALNFIIVKKPSQFLKQLVRMIVATSTTTTVLRPFFRDHPGELVPEKNFWNLWCKARLTEAETLTICWTPLHPD